MGRKRIKILISEEEVCRLYQAGTPVDDICKEAGLSYKNVLYSILKRHGVPTQGRSRGAPSTKLSDPVFVERLTTLYHQGVRTQDIGQALDISATDVFKYLNKLKVPLNRQPNAVRARLCYIVAITPKATSTTYSGISPTRTEASNFVKKVILENNLEGDILVSIKKWQTDA